MAFQTTVYNILVAGPSDVEQERREIALAIDAWNQRHSDHMKMMMRPVKWETDSAPELGDDPQALVNRRIADRCDAVVAVFGAQVGSSTPRAISGTVEELSRFEGAGKPTMLYFSTAPIPRDLRNDPQLDALDRF